MCVELAEAGGVPLPGHEWQTVIKTLGLQPHPEGGYYREVFRSDVVVRDAVGQPRSAGTSIYYLLAEGAFSAWHRIDADELWYFHCGAALTVHILADDETLVSHVLGDPRHRSDGELQLHVPAGCWFAAELQNSASYALVSCAVMPGFDFAGFELAEEADLATAIQRHGGWLRRLLYQA